MQELRTFPSSNVAYPTAVVPQDIVSALVASSEKSAMMQYAAGQGNRALYGAGFEALERTSNAIEGKRTATESFSYNTGKTDKDGKALMKDIAKGENFSTKNNPALAEYVKNHNVSQVERGRVGKVTGAFRNQVRDKTSGKDFSQVNTRESQEKSFDKTNKTSEKNKNNSTSNDIEEKVKHKDPFEGKKFNEAGGRTTAYQTHLDSLQNSGEKVNKGFFSSVGDAFGKVYDGVMKSPVFSRHRGKFSLAATTALTSYALSGSDAEAATLKPIGAPSPQQVPEASFMDNIEGYAQTATTAVATGFNAFTGYMGMNEMKSGVKSNSIVKDVFKGVASSGGVGKFALKKLPVARSEQKSCMSFA